MLQFVCDSCSAVKQPEEIWIVGLAAEAVGVVSARREVNIQSRWTREAALHPLAVHFCSIQCKNDYMTKLFGSTAANEIVVESTAPASAEVIVEREIPAAEKVVTKTRRVHRRKAS
jgi:hypothetical protein